MVPASVFLVILVAFLLEAILILADQIVLAQRRERAYWANVRREVDAEPIDWEREGWA